MDKGSEILWPQKIKDLRALLGMNSQTDLAEALGCNQSTVSHWERGDFAPSPEFYLKMGDLLGSQDEVLARWFWQQSGLRPEVTATAERGYALEIAGIQSQIENLEVARKGADKEEARAIAKVLQEIKRELATLERKSHRERLRGLIQQRLEMLALERQALTSRTEDMFQILRARLERNTAVVSELLSFDERFEGVCEKLRAVETPQRRDQVYEGSRWDWHQISIRTDASTEILLKEVLQGLDALPLEGEERPPGCKTYEASSGILGLKGLVVSRGERLYLRPDDRDVQQVIQAGALRELPDESGEPK